MTCEHEGDFSTSTREERRVCFFSEGVGKRKGGQDVWPHHSGALSADLSILSTRFRKPFKFVFAVRTDLHDEDKCRLSMRPFISTKLEHIFLVPHFCSYFFFYLCLTLFTTSNIYFPSYLETIYDFFLDSVWAKIYASINYFLKS